MAKDKIKVIGFTLSITFVMAIALILFLKAIGVIFDPWFTRNAIVLAVVTGIIVVIGIVTGSIAFGSFMAKQR